jgi:hypothetical protein
MALTTAMQVNIKPETSFESAAFFKAMMQTYSTAHYSSSSSN